MPPTPRKPVRTAAKKRTPKTKAQIAAEMRDATTPPADLTPTPAGQWRKKGVAELEGVDLPLPSGNVARVKRVGLMDLLVEGHIPDGLTLIAEQAVKKGKGLPKSEVKKLLDDPEKVRDIGTLMNRVVVSCVIAPKVLPVPLSSDGAPLPWDERPEGLYVDEVLDEDKLYVMDFAFGGARDVERFRAEHGDVVADLLVGENVEDAAE